MRKLGFSGTSWALICALGTVVFTSCKDDDGPTKYQLSFAQETSTATESDESFTSTINLDKPAGTDVVISYTLTGDAYDDIRAATSDTELEDFTVDGDYGEVTIPAGETSGTITFIPFSDDELEDDEPIIITITKVSDLNVEFAPGLSSTITLNQENGMGVVLAWQGPTADSLADMDLFVRIGATAATPTWNGVLTGSVYRGYDRNTEAVFIPNAFIGNYFNLGYQNTTYGFTYTYYAGTRDSLGFASGFIEFKDGDFVGEGTDYPGLYKQSNRNAWTGQNYPSSVVQRMDNNGTAFSNISQITTVPNTSRMSVGDDSKIITAPKNSKVRVSDKLRTISSSGERAQQILQRADRMIAKLRARN